MDRADHAEMEDRAVRALRVVALLESSSFAVLLVCSVLKRTTDVDLVPVMGPVHGALFIALVLLVLACRTRIGWSWTFTALMLTVGSPGAHFAVAATPDPGVTAPSSA